ncbi:hypothetical protein ANCCAN_29778 [Ancylostoma caninum]|uniref:Uncharacterized protein n=1 Tax=Ancylostoma caninum TaxID=29170 RepID=A0A368EXM1_ANCCA|nr:hypothetical protein ANCCAN_29778 [Ancylostoma caninum]
MCTKMFEKISRVSLGNCLLWLDIQKCTPCAGRVASLFLRTLTVVVPMDLSMKNSICFSCHWKKYYGDANQQNPQSLLSTCADTGKCPIEGQTSPSSFILVDITNSTSNYGTTCTMPNIILLHHTVEPTADQTIEVLNQRGLSVQYIGMFL